MSECVIMATPIVDALGSACDSTTMRSPSLVGDYGLISMTPRSNCRRYAPVLGFLIAWAVVAEKMRAIDTESPWAEYVGRNVHGWVLLWVSEPAVYYGPVARARRRADGGSDGGQGVLARPRVLKEPPDERAEATTTFH
jgi:hypothetical protein